MHFLLTVASTRSISQKENGKNVLRDYVKLRYALIPYIYSASIGKGSTDRYAVLYTPCLLMCFPDDRKTV